MVSFLTPISNAYFNLPLPPPLPLSLPLPLHFLLRTNTEAIARFESDSLLTFHPPSTPVILNVSGQIFTTTVSVLTTDKFSVLASLCTTEPPLQPDDDGVFFIERDWWVFRYILQFLRNSTLPRDTALLEEMYTEASFYRLNSLRRAIELKASTVTVKSTTRIEGHSNGSNGGGGLLVPGGGGGGLPDPYRFVR
jgi:hypothetical protein